MSAPPPAEQESEEASARDKLARIEHIVVLQLENRSFDHMLGYLGLPEHAIEPHDGEFGVDVNGLQNARSNFHQEVEYAPGPFDETGFRRHDLDPPHDAPEVEQQIGDGKMTGFVDAWAAKLHKKNGPFRWFKRSFARLRRRPYPDPGDLKTVMGHVTPRMVPIFDHLARKFCVCDNWFCSVRGATMPNRFYSVAADHDGEMDNVKLLVGKRGKFKSLFRFLPRQDMWRWYSSDPGMLRAIDHEYRFDIDPAFDHFAYFDTCSDVQRRTFLSDVLKTEELPEVAWIDPNFAIAQMVPPPVRGIVFWLADGVGSNDDHPPIGLIEAQRLVNKVYEALGRSRYWDNTLLVVYYDEHGGFYDHQEPPPSRGPRIPALVVGGRVKRGVCHAPLDHASVIKTILLRFGEDAIAKMPPAARARVEAATDLSVTLRDDEEVVPFSPVDAPGGAAITERDLEPERLDEDASHLVRAVDLLDRALTDLQELIVRYHAIPLRTGRDRLARVPTKRLTKLAARRLPEKRYAPDEPNKLPPRRP